MRIALATCRDLPDREVDDRPLELALQRRGADVVQPAWDDESFEWTGVDACLIRTTWDYMERREHFVAWAEDVARATRLFNPAGVVRWNTDKRYLRELEVDGLPIVPTIWLERGSRPELADRLAERGWTRAFLKPAVGATSRETLRFRADAEGLAAATAHLERLLPAEDFLLQPYLASVETRGEVSAVFLDGEPTHAVRKLPVPGDYRVQDDFGASDEPTALTGEELELVRATLASAAERLGEPELLYARVDLLSGDGGRPLLNELELVEPSLFFRHAPRAADVLAQALLGRI